MDAKSRKFCKAVCVCSGVAVTLLLVDALLPGWQAEWLRTVMPQSAMDRATAAGLILGALGADTADQDGQGASRGSCGTCDEGNRCDPQTNVCLVGICNGGARVQFWMQVYRRVYISKSALCGTTWEYGEVRLLLDMLRGTKRGVFLDIGANLGSWTLPVVHWMRQHHAEARVVALEAVPHVATALQHSVSVNRWDDMVRIHNCAVVADPTKKTFCVEMESADISQVENIGQNQVNLGERDFCKQEVPAKSLDELTEVDPWMQEVLAMKMDCEGCEAQALLGGKRFLNTTRPCVIGFELTEQYLCESQTSSGELATYLRAFGYDVRPLQKEIHGDGSCYSFTVGADEGKWDRLIQSFVWLRQQSVSECMSRFN